MVVVSSRMQAEHWMDPEGQDVGEQGSTTAAQHLPQLASQPSPQGTLVPLGGQLIVLLLLRHPQRAPALAVGSAVSASVLARRLCAFVSTLSRHSLPARYALVLQHRKEPACISTSTLPYIWH